MQTARALRHALLCLFLLLAQAGALAHATSHIREQLHGHEPACEQCLAFAAMGACAASAPLAWTAPTQDIPCDPSVAREAPSFHRSHYQSRAPPLPVG